MPHTTHNIPELLAPAGGRDALIAAVVAGADAVYVGAGRFNARVSAEGFDAPTLAWSCKFAHAHGVRVYAALNIMIYEHEMTEALKLARDVLALGADALIVADLGLLRRLRAEMPEVELHLSTQAGAQSAQAVRVAAQELGCARVTVARELTLDEIEAVAATGVPIEVFCHGAICIAYSGACAFSALRRGRSAMRGDCTQPCRQSYGLEDAHGHSVATPDGAMLLCPRDYLGVGHVGELARAGVASLKIEGRMKNPDYVYNVTRIYRAALDAYAAGLPFDAERAERALGRSFNRGFTDAYLRGSSGAELMSFERSCNQGVRVGVLVARRHEAVEVAFEAPVAAGDMLEIRSTPGPDAPADVPKRWPMVPCPENAEAGERLWVRCKRRVEVGSVVHLVRSVAVLDEVRAQLDAALEGAAAEAADAADAVEMPAVLNAKVSGTDDGLEAPASEAGTPDVAEVPRVAFPESAAQHDAPLVHAPAEIIMVATPDEAWRQYCDADAAPASPREVGVFAWRMLEDRAAWDDLLGSMTVVLDEVLRADDVERCRALCTQARRVVCRNLGELELARAAGVPFDVAPPLYAANVDAIHALRALGAERVVMPDELAPSDRRALMSVAGDVSFAVLRAPSPELMVCEHCLLTAEGPCSGSCATCTRRQTEHMLVCSDGTRLPVVVDALGRTRIFDASTSDAPVEDADTALRDNTAAGGTRGER